MNQYHIYDVIGRGKHSTVYKGRKKKTIEYHAIKSVEKSQKTKVLQEVRAFYSLDHNNVLKFYAWYETSAHLWLVLEYCVGGDLLTLLRQDTRLPEESIHDFARDLVQALQFLHSKGVIYCDLKPSNVLLDENGRLKLCDFGLARRLSDIAKSSVQELPQTKRGTPCYMAPELFQEGSVHSYGSDLWALGCVMYECYTGRPPFVSNSFTQLVYSIVSAPMPQISGNPCPEFQHLVSRLLVKDPVERIQWDELRNHPFWRTKCRELPLPPQPALTNFLRLTHRSSSPVEKPLLSGGSTPVEKRAPGSRGVMVDRATLREKVQNLPKKPEIKCVGQDAKGVPENRNLGYRENGRKVTKGSTSNTQPKQLKPNSNGGAPVVNVLRLSKIVKTNLLKETENDTYRQQSTANGTSDDTDVTLENHDLELNFGKGAESDPTEEEDEAGSNGSSTIASAEEKALHKTSAKPTHAPAAKGKSRGSSNGAELSLPVTPPQYESNGSTENHLLTHVKSEGKQVDAMRHVATTPSGLCIPRKGSHRATPGTGELRKEAVVIPRNPSRPLVVLSQSLWHPSDLSVRPIMLNRRIEKVPESTFDSRILPAERLVSTEFVKLNAEHQEVFLNKIMGNISGSTVSMNEKINTLKFVETLCTNIDAANKLINGPLMLSLVKLLRTVKFAALRVRLASVMGLLIRHATLIEEELAGSGIVAVLTETLRDKQDKVRRCAMATLGELLFYVASQNEGTPRATGGRDNSTNYVKSSMWQIPGTTIALVASILRRGEDDVTQHYALKTIENIASQGGEWTQRFTSNEVIDNLCYTFRAAAKPENLRATAGSCLVRLVRFQPTTIPVVLERLTPKDLVGGLGKGKGREQQVNINLLNMTLVGSSVLPISRYLHAIVEERSLVSIVVSMLGQGTEILRGKALVCAALLCKNRRCLPSLCNAKLLPAVDKLSKEKDPYVQQCIEAFVQTTAGVVPTILDSICTDITQLASGRRTPGPGSSPARGTPRSSLPLFPVILNLVNSPTFKTRMIDEHVLEKLASFLKRLETSSFQGQDEFQSTLLQIMEVMSQQSTTLLTFPDIFIAKVLPSLSVLYEKNTDGDIRFLCLKVFFDSLVVFLDDISPVNAAEDRQLSSTVLSAPRREKLEVIVKQHFIPMYPILVEDEDPIPMYAQKLLVMLLDLKCIQIEDILQLKLISQFFEFLQCDLASINLHNVRLCLHLASSPKVDSKVISDLGIVSHVGALLDFVHAKGMQDFLDLVLSVCRSLLIRNVEDGLESNNSNAASSSSANGRKLSVSAIQDIGDLGQHAAIFLELCGSREPQVAEAAAECLILLLKTAPRSSAGPVFSSVGRFGNLLEMCARSHTPSISAKLQSQLLFAISASCKAVREAQPLLVSHPSSSDLVSLENIVGRLCKSSASQVAEVAGVAAFELQRVNHSTYSIVNRSRIEEL